VRLFVSATNVRTGKIKVFTTGEISADVLMASACLPFLHRTVEVGGEHYWDGGYVGIPPSSP
jgi:NTE family protein